MRKLEIYEFDSVESLEIEEYLRDNGFITNHIFAIEDRKDKSHKFSGQYFKDHSKNLAYIFAYPNERLETVIKEYFTKNLSKCKHLPE